MTDEQPKIVPPVSADEVVNAVVEKAADKVASAAVNPTTNGNGGHLSRTEAFVVAAVLIILNMASLWVGLGMSRGLNEHQDDFKSMCQAFVQLTPEAQSRQLAQLLAECLN